MTPIPTSEISATAQPLSGCTLADYAAHKRIPEEFLKGFGLTDARYAGVPAVRIPYYGVAGDVLAVRFRTGIEKPDDGAMPDTRFLWRTGDKPGLYGLDHLPEVREGIDVILVEGESDCHVLWFHGYPALGIPGASNWRDKRDAEHVDGFERVYVIREPGTGGDTLIGKLRASPIRDRLHVIDASGFGDVADLHVAGPDGFPTAFDATMQRAVPIAEIEQAERRHAREAAWTACAELAQRPDILEALARDVGLHGVIGEERLAKLVYLTVVTRHLTKPVSLVVKGPSSGGKSFVVERTLGFFSEDAYYALTAMSEHALAYDDEPLTHRMLVLYEAAGLRGETANYFVRSILSEGRLRYATVEKTSEGLRPRLIEREGPTGLITTTTKVALHRENETRLLSVSVNDSPAQTKAILLAQARDSDADVEPAIDFSAWHALDTWLATGPTQVRVPFLREIAERVPPSAVRLRRDFQAVIALIRAHALLHQANRSVEAGCVMAEHADYVAVYDLVADIVAEGVEASVPPIIRETVVAVTTLLTEGHEHVTVKQVAQALGLDKASASRRLHVARERGYLRNLEDRKGRAAQLVLGDPLPADESVLPHPTTLAAARGCTVAEDSEGYTAQRSAEHERVVFEV